MTRSHDRTRPAVAAAYDEWSATYDSDRNRTRDLDADVLRRQRLELAAADVIEVGCGTGKNTVWLAEHARSVLAFDLSEGMLARARARVSSERVRFVRHDLTDPWPAAPASCDVVVANLVLEHIDVLGGFFAQAAAALRPGGRLFSCELHPIRQWRGAQAHFARPGTGEVQPVPAFLHGCADYLNAGLGAGLVLVEAGEWREAEAGAHDPPRLFSTLWRRD